ncbi:MAG: polysaccharide pyruvyl transferase family protein [Pseudomonadota bacterium]
MQQRLTIGLLWHSTHSANLGVGALTLGHLALLDRLTERLGIVPRYVVLGARDPVPDYIVREDVETVAIPDRQMLRPIGGLGAALRPCDVVLDIGAGDSFADIYGVRRFLRLTVPKIAALMLKRPLVLAPQTIGPFERPWVRRMAVATMDRADLVASRDTRSTDYLKHLGHRGPAIEATDVALLLPHTPPPKARKDQRIRVGLNVSGLLFAGGYHGGNQFGLALDYPSLIRHLLASLTADERIEVHLIGHVLAPSGAVEDDHNVCERLAGEFPGTICAPRFAGGPSEAKSYIAGMDVFAGARMHACIAAFSTGVAVVPMAYSRKFAGLFGTLGYDLVADLKVEDAASVEAKILDAIERRQTLSKAARAGTARGLKRLERYETALTPILKGCAR